MAATFDFNLHNSVYLRLMDVRDKDRKAIQRQIGLKPTSIDHEPDIVIRFVDHLPDRQHLRYMVMEQAGFLNESFVAIKSSGLEKRLVSIPFHEIGNQCELVAESGIGEIPLLNQIINLTALNKGLLPIHASAFDFNNHGVMVSGWPHGGKTSILFSFLSHGAKFISDDWVFSDKDNRLYGLLQPVKLSDWQLVHLPQFSQQLTRKRRYTMKFAAMLDAIEQMIPSFIRKKFPPASMYRLIVRYGNKKLRHVYISPAKLLAEEHRNDTTELDILLLPMSHAADDIVVEPTDTETAVGKLSASLRYEWQKVMDYYLQFRYAFPQHRNALLDDFDRLHVERLSALLAGKKAYMVYHSHPVELPDLYTAVEPYLTDNGE